MNIFIIVPIAIAGLIIFLWLTYNRLVTLKLRVDEAWSQIDVQLKRRIDLIPNLVETVKAYAKHEKGVFEEVTKARSNLLSAKTIGEKADAEDILTKALKSIFAVAEAYPNLRASENFKTLQEELSDTEDKIAYSRQFYNQVVMDYNTSLRVFPEVLLAGRFGFTQAEFFGKEISTQERQAVKVSF